MEKRYRAGDVAKSIKNETGKLVAALFIPTLLQQIGMVMTSTFIPLYAMDLGAGIVMAGLIVTAKSLGAMIFNIPAGFIIGRWRASYVMMIGLGGILTAALLRGLSPTPLFLLLASFLMGAFTTLWDLTRLTYIKSNIPIEIRGRVLSALGGLFRLSRIIGPLLGGLIISVFGYKPIFFIQAALTLLALLLISLFLPHGKKISAVTQTESMIFLKNHLLKNKRNITAAVIGIIGLSLLRISRDFILPLWADHIGLTVAILGFTTSTAAALELTLFYPAGWIMDNLGRKWALVPAILIMSLAFLFLPFTKAFPGFLIINLLISVGNGFGSGINMTIGTDLAPSRAAGQFLGIWRFFSDGAMAAGPVVIGLISRTFSLSVSPYTVSIIGFSTVLILVKYMDRMKQTKPEPGDHCG
jgi:MFS family permease